MIEAVGLDFHDLLLALVVWLTMLYYVMYYLTCSGGNSACPSNKENFTSAATFRTCHIFSEDSLWELFLLANSIGLSSVSAGKLLEHASLQITDSPMDVHF